MACRNGTPHRHIWRSPRLHAHTEDMTQRRTVIVVVLGSALLAVLVAFLLNGPLSCGSAQTWFIERGCWPRPSAN